METVKEITYAIGDVHGMAFLLERLLMMIEDDALASGATARLIFIGDLVDRGPNSKEAVELVFNALKINASSSLILGNHDEWLLKFGLGELSWQEFNNWMMNGGEM